MKTVLLEINDDKAYRLLEDLEALNIIRVIKKEETQKQKLSKQFAGSLHLSDDEYKNFQNSVAKR